MSTISGCVKICNAIQQSLADVANGASPLSKRTQTGFLQSLTSPLNTGDQIRVDQGNGKRRAVEVIYQQRQTEDEVEDTPSGTCVSTNPICDHVTDFDVALYKMANFYIDEADLAVICDGTRTRLDQGISSTFEALNRSINDSLINAASTKFGVNQATGLSTVTTLDIYDETTGAVKADVWNTLWDQLKNKNQFSGMPMISAGSTFFKANNTLKFSCCNTDGIDMLAAARQAGYGYFNDQMIDTTLGTDEAILYEPGAAKFVTWYKYRNLGPVLNNEGAYAAFEMENGEMRGLITDPAPGGLTYNIRIFWDKCEEKYSVFIELNFDLFVLPTDMYKSGDPLEGSNSFLYYKFT